MTEQTGFAGWGPFASGLSDVDLMARLDRLGRAVFAQGFDYAGLAEAVRLSKMSPRSLAGLPTRLDGVPANVRDAIKTAYDRSA